MTETDAGILMVVNLLQEAKANDAISLTLLGIVNGYMAVQPENVPMSIFFKLLGRVTDWREDEPENAYVPISVTVLGRMTDCNW